MDRQRVRIQKQAYRAEQFNNLVDTRFTTFIKPIQEVDTDTVEELFRLYDKLYYSIPAKGENNSHEYLLKKSSEITDFEKSTEDIQPLLDEIAQLRQQLLQANEQIFELEKNG